MARETASSGGTVPLVWISSSSKEIAPVIEIDGKPVADGKAGDVWLAAQTLYSAHKFDF